MLPYGLKKLGQPRRDLGIEDRAHIIARALMPVTLPIASSILVNPSDDAHLYMMTRKRDLEDGKEISHKALQVPPNIAIVDLGLLTR